MRVATTRLNAHEAYLHALNRALRVGLVVSLVVHAALAGLLPSPFHHDHPLPRALEVELVEAPTPPPPAEPAKPPSVASPAPMPVAPAALSKPEAARSHKRVAPIVRETERLLTHAEPERAVTSVPVSPEGPAIPEKPAATPSAIAKEAGVDAGPIAPPAFRAGYLRNPEPQYPTASRRLGEQGTVQLRVLVSAEGRPVRVDVHRSSSYPRLDEAAAAAIREWRFVPAKRGTTPVEAAVIVPIVFRLEAE